MMDSAVSQSEVRHEHEYIFFAPKPTQRAFIATSDHRKINEKRCINSFKQYNTSVSGVVSLLKINDRGGGPEDQGKVRFAQKRLRTTGLLHITALSDYSLIHFSQFTSSRFEE